MDILSASAISVHGERVIFYVRGNAAFDIEYAELRKVACRPFGQVVIQAAMRRGLPHAGTVVE